MDLACKSPIINTPEVQLFHLAQRAWVLSSSAGQHGTAINEEAARPWQQTAWGVHTEAASDDGSTTACVHRPSAEQEGHSCRACLCPKLPSQSTEHNAATLAFFLPNSIAKSSSTASTHGQRVQSQEECCRPDPTKMIRTWNKRQAPTVEIIQLLAQYWLLLGLLQPAHGREAQKGRHRAAAGMRSRATRTTILGI